jgi:ABC-2 type transport system permease protein
MYAAGIAVMFLLFSASGAGGSLLEEHEAGTLDRLLSSRLTVTQLLAGKWLYITLLGCGQLTAMFAWAQIAFDVDLLGHLSGFIVMTMCTAAASASLALCLAVVCRSRSQLNGLSIILILTMSALGGSMIPRYIMSQEMQRWGLLTFNAWALDGFKKVFWYDLPVSSIATEISVLLIMGFVLACVARIFAYRWEAK